jgi:hypothetical protein
MMSLSQTPLTKIHTGLNILERILLKLIKEEHQDQVIRELLDQNDSLDEELKESAQGKDG